MTVHTVQFNSLEEYEDAALVADTITETLRDKDGNAVLVKVISAERHKRGISVADTIEYRAQYADGPYRCLLLCTVLDGRLYNVTAQAPEELWEKVETVTRGALESARLCLTTSRFFTK